MNQNDEQVTLKISYDKEADSAYIYFDHISDNEIAETIIANESGEYVDGDINLDIDKDKKLRGIEILNASNILPGEIMRRYKR